MEIKSLYTGYIHRVEMAKKQTSINGSLEKALLRSVLGFASVEASHLSESDPENPEVLPTELLEERFKDENFADAFFYIRDIQNVIDIGYSVPTQHQFSYKPFKINVDFHSLDNCDCRD